MKTGLRNGNVAVAMWKRTLNIGTHRSDVTFAIALWKQSITTDGVSVNVYFHLPDMAIQFAQCNIC